MIASVMSEIFYNLVVLSKGLVILLLSVPNCCSTLGSVLFTLGLSQFRIIIIPKSLLHNTTQPLKDRATITYGRQKLRFSLCLYPKLFVFAQQINLTYIRYVGSAGRSVGGMGSMSRFGYCKSCQMQ